MTEVELFRTTTAELINENPSTISITKKVYSDNGSGGMSETTTTLTSFIGRIFRRGFGAPEELVQLAGLKQREEYELLTPYDADISETSENVKQTFTVGTDTYEVTDLVVTKYQGEVVLKRALLKKVK